MRSSFQSIKSLAERYDYFIFDCDGVLWHGEEIHIGNAFRNIEWLESQGKKVFFVTNNANLSRRSMKEKMATDVFKYNASIDSLYPASTIACQYVKQKMPDVKKVYYTGSAYIGEELESAGIEPSADNVVSYKEKIAGEYLTHEELEKYPFDEEVGAVISGWDPTVDYTRLSLASIYLQKCKQWVVCNEDAYTIQHGYRAMGGGTLVAAVEYSLRKPGSTELIVNKVVTGKPNPGIVELIRNHHDIPAEALDKFVMIGDRPDTDIQMANNAGIASCLVLTGVTQTMEDLDTFINQNQKNQPTYIVNSFGQDIDLE